MADPRFKAAYEEALAEAKEPGFLARLADAARTARHADLDAVLFINLALTRVAFVTPEAIMAIYDTWTKALLHEPSEPSEHTPTEALLAERAALPEPLWQALWTIIEQPADSTLTPRIAALGGYFESSMRLACARAQRSFPGQAELSNRMPPRLTMQDLEGHPAGSLGEHFRSLIVDNGFDLDVLDPASVVGFQPELDLTNLHILQQHEIWHLVAGYSTSPQHEVAISAFQLAQFGHLYSAMFLAIVTLKVALELPAYVVPMLQLIAEGWLHGRRTIPLMNIDWRAELGHELSAIRSRHGVVPFQPVGERVPPTA